MEGSIRYSLLKCTRGAFLTSYSFLTPCPYVLILPILVMDNTVMDSSSTISSVILQKYLKASVAIQPRQRLVVALLWLPAVAERGGAGDDHSPLGDPGHVGRAARPHPARGVRHQ